MSHPESKNHPPYALSRDHSNRNRTFDHSAYDDIKRAWRTYLRPQSGLLALAVLAMLAMAATSWLLPWLIENLLDDLLVAKNSAALPWLVQMVALIFIVRSVSVLLQRGITQTISIRALGALRTEVALHALKLDYGFFAKNPPGELIARQTSDTANLRVVVESTILGLARDLPTMLGLFVYLVYQDWIWTLFSLIAAALIIVPVRVSSRYIRSYSRRSAGVDAQITIAYDEAYHGIQAVKTNQAEAFEADRFRTRIKQFVRIAIKSAWIAAALPAVIELVTMTAMIFVIYFGGKAVIAGEKTPGEVIAYITTLMLLYEPLKRVIGINAYVQRISASLSRVYEVLDKPAYVVDKPQAQTLANPKGKVCFDQVGFAYDPDQSILNATSFTVEPGQKVALVGASGSGKTTCLLLVPRLFDIQEGAISIGGQDIADVTQESLRSAIAYVTQDPILFDDTIRANINMGRRDASEAEIEAAARAAQAWGFISALPDGLDTQVGPRGERLSGGQKQRVAIARAILRDAPILLLDEATSALDTETERDVQATLDALSADRTTIVVAHRLSTVINADKILVFQNGEVVEQGSHEELVRHGKVYAALIESQMA